MLKSFLIILLAGLLMTACAEKETNPLLIEWDTPFGTPPFDQIKTEHYLPAFKSAIEKHNTEIEAITSNTGEPTFENSVEALEYSGADLTKVERIFNAMTGAMISDELQKVSKEVSPLLSKHNDDVNLNPKLFERIKAVYDQKDQLNLSDEQKVLLDKK